MSTLILKTFSVSNAFKKKKNNLIMCLQKYNETYQSLL